ncbi:MAG: ABC transporter permease [Rhodothermales bacterium]|nr:ABC transporter permease [Rhodothermales bacterium]MBO6779502.1 ABC transporter permease [Rhodothermales bacterium]
MSGFLFELLEGLRIALRAIRVNKMRSLLTTLGIIIGIVSVTAMATVVSGIEGQFEEDMAELGTDVLYIERMPWVQGPGTKWWEFINRPRMQAEVAEAVQRRARSAEAVTTVAQTFRGVTYKERVMSRGVVVNGVSHTYPDVHEVLIEHGTFFTEMDDRAARKVAVIGSEIALQLFPVEDPVGKDIRIGGTRYRVIGVGVREGQGADQASGFDWQVRIPFGAFEQEYGTRYRDVSVQVKVRDEVSVEEAMDELTGVVRVARGLDAREDDNFEVNESGAIRAAVEPVKFAIFAIGIGLTSLSLLVGGIGVMNIMFVSVKERTREIGIRKAVGAKRRTIMLQFLIEAVAVSLMGGIVGVLLSVPIFLGVRTILPAELGPGVVMLAFGICMAVGTVFGIAPAWSAAKAEPIEALRYE